MLRLIIKLDITHKSGKYGMQVRIHRKDELEPELDKIAASFHPL